MFSTEMNYSQHHNTTKLQHQYLYGICKNACECAYHSTQTLSI